MQTGWFPVTGMEKERSFTNFRGEIHQKQNDSSIQVVSFRLENEEFGLDILRVQEILRSMEITPIPSSPDFVEGIVNLRGKVVPVINLRKRFGFPVRACDKDCRIVVSEIAENTVGFDVDGVREVLHIPLNTIEPPPSMVLGTRKDYFFGVGKLKNRLILLVDLDKILTNQEIMRLKEVT